MIDVISKLKKKAHVIEDLEEPYKVTPSTPPRQLCNTRGDAGDDPSKRPPRIKKLIVKAAAPSGIKVYHIVENDDCSSGELHPRVTPLQSMVAFWQINRNAPLPCTSDITRERRRG